MIIIFPFDWIIHSGGKHGGLWADTEGRHRGLWANTGVCPYRIDCRGRPLCLPLRFKLIWFII